MTRYADGTAVHNSKSRYEIEQMLREHGAENYAYMVGPTHAAIAFKLEGRFYRIQIPIPSAEEFTRTPERGLVRTKSQAKAAYESEVNRRWRSLAAVIKFKFVAIDDGITSVEDEFLAATVTPDNRTVGEYMRPHLEAAYSGGRQLPAMPWNCLPAPKSEAAP